eukprot:SM000072S21170  [mRNA]  locus=s72:76198:84318:+ [translate_table: standard]
MGSIASDGAANHKEGLNGLEGPGAGHLQPPSLSEAGRKAGTHTPGSSEKTAGRSSRGNGSSADGSSVSRSLAAGDRPLILEDDNPSRKSADRDSWTSFLTNEQQLLFASLGNEAAVAEETLWLQQQQVHFAREETELAAMHARAERYLEEEQEQEHEDLLSMQNQQDVEDAESDENRSRTHRQPLRIALNLHFQKLQLAQQRYFDLQKAHRQLQLQQGRMCRAREAFNVRMQQREERQMRERKELFSANQRKQRNQQIALELQLTSLPKEKRDIALKVHAAAAGQAKVMQAKLAEQLREMQLLQLQNGSRAFEYDQQCKTTMHELEAAHLEQMQKILQDHALELATRNNEMKAELYTFKQKQKKELALLPTEALRQKQRKAAKKLHRRLQREAQARQEARKAGMEADFAEFLTVLQDSSDSGGIENMSYVGSLYTASQVAWDEDAHLNQAADEDSPEEDMDVIEKRVLEQQAKELEIKEASVARQMQRLKEKHHNEENNLGVEHKAAVRNLRTRQQQGAANLQQKMENEMKEMKKSHYNEKQMLSESQNKAAHAFRQAIRLERQMTQLSEEHKRNLNDFLSFICHELRNPLCGISACIQLIQTSPEAEKLGLEIMKHIASMEHQSNLMTTIVNDVLDMRKIEEGKLEFIHVTFDICELVEDIVVAQQSFAAHVSSATSMFGASRSSRSYSENFSNSHAPAGVVDSSMDGDCTPGQVVRKEASVRIAVKIDSNVPHRVIGDPTRLRQVISNLLSNAIKFTPQGSVTVQVSLHSVSEENYVVLKVQVTDTGIGISKENIDRLFKKYHQLGAKDHPKIVGTGLGLAICKTLINQMGGEIGVTSQMGIGQNDDPLVKLPSVDEAQDSQALPSGDTQRAPAALAADQSLVASASDGATQADSAALASGDGIFQFSSNLKVLLAEDSPVLQRTSWAMLKRLGIEADIASDGQEALDMCSAKEYDLLLCDHQMPKYTGEEVAQKLRRQGYTGAIVACTANAMPYQVAQYRASGMDEVLVKPFKFKELVTLLQQALEAAKDPARRRKGASMQVLEVGELGRRDTDLKGDGNYNPTLPYIPNDATSISIEAGCSVPASDLGLRSQRASFCLEDHVSTMLHIENTSQESNSSF